MTFDHIITFIHDNQLMFGLLVSAAIGTMPDNLPAAIRQVPAWCYGWFHDAAKTFMNYRNHQEPPNTK